MQLAKPDRFLASLTLSILISWSVYASEPFSYSYRLVESKDNQLCHRMTAVYNEHFSRPFDDRILSKLRKDSPIPIHSRYPSSAEFDAIKWELKTYPLTRPDGRKERWTALVAQFDIDNDGTEDVIAKSSFFRGAPDGFEELIVFSTQDFNLKAVVDGKEFFEGQQGSKKPRVVSLGAAILRPFVVGGSTYLSSYDYERYTSLPGIGTTGNAPHTPPESIRIYRYEGGGHVFRGNESALRITELCVITISRTK